MMDREVAKMNLRNFVSCLIFFLFGVTLLEVKEIEVVTFIGYYFVAVSVIRFFFEAGRWKGHYEADKGCLK